MLYKPAEGSFRKGMEALKLKNDKEAMAFFEAALTLDLRKMSNHSGQPRYRSYLGLCNAITGGKLRDSLELCRKAANEEFYNSELWLNLGRVETTAGNKWKAHEAFVRGYRLARAKDRKQFLRFLDELGLRRPPVLTFLNRSHPINVMLGRMTFRKSN